MIEHLSYSSVSTYLFCPKSWWWRYIERPRVPVSVALPFGTAIHKVVETYVGARAEGHEVKPLVELWPQCWDDAQNEPRNKDNINWGSGSIYHAELGARMLSAPGVIAAVEGIEPMITLTPEETAIIEKRVEFFVPGVPVPVIGYVDLIEKDGVPVDLKTAARKWSGGKEHSEMQADFYLLALNQEDYMLNPDLRFRYIIFTKTKSPICQVLETSRTWGQLLFTTKVIREVWEAIQAGAFPCNVTSWKCSEKWCSYWDLCRGKEL